MDIETIIEEDFREQQRLDNLDYDELEQEEDIIIRANNYKVGVGKVLEGIKL